MNFNRSKYRTSKNYLFIRLKRILQYIVISMVVMTVLHIYFEGERSFAVKLYFSAIFGVLLGLSEDFLRFNMFNNIIAPVKLVIRLFLFVVIQFIAVALTALLLERELHVGDGHYFEIFIMFYKNGSVAVMTMVCFIVVLLYEVRMVVGKRFFTDYFTGRYVHPRLETRVFMFLDLESSTTIAEKLGDVRYHDFLNDCFFLLSSPIEQSKAEIVKYVGDEVILTWNFNPKKDYTKVLVAYRDFMREIDARKKYFEVKYGYVPVFKAGVHFGEVVTSYLGYLKKQKDFSGDIMNTTARILGYTKECDGFLLTSGDFFHYVRRNTLEYTIIPDVILKGKQHDVDIIRVDKFKKS